MIFMPYHPTLHNALIQGWLREYESVFIESPDDSKPSLTFIVIINEKPVGWIQAYNIDEQNLKAQIGIGLDRAGLRIAWRVCMEMGKIVFGQLGMKRAYCRVLATNSAPVRLLRRLGFVEEGREREAVRIDGQPYDVVVYGLLRTDWRF